VFLALSAINIFFGELNQDEGWYLYAARLTAEGRVPYLDYAFTQGPFFPRLYAWADPLVRWGGVGAARALTAALGLLGALLTARAAERMSAGPAAPAAAVAVWLLLTLNSYQSYFTTVVKTYSLTTVFLAVAMGELAMAARPGGARRAFLAGMALAAATAVRLSAGAAALAVALWLLARRRQVARGAAAAFIAGGALVGIAAFGPSWLWAKEGLLFGLVEYHAGRSAGGGWTPWIFRAGFVSRMLLAYWPAVAAALAWGLARRAAGQRATAAGVHPSDALGWAAAAMTAVHVLAPFPYDDYQVIVYPLFAVWLGTRWTEAALPLGPPPVGAPAGLGKAADPIERRLGWLAAIGLVAVVSAPINQQWVILRRDRIWWRPKAEADLMTLRRAAQWLEARVPADEPLLTQDLYLAVEARRRVPSGFEMGPFSYFPGMSRDRAERLHVLNRERWLETIERAEAPWAAVSGYGLSIASPAVVELPLAEQARLKAALERRYEWMREIPDFGQAHTTLNLYRRRDAACD
jgi:hypothetical protein